VAAEVKESHGIEVELIPGKGGVFKVIIDGKLVYDKADTGEFPKVGEVSARLSQK